MKTRSNMPLYVVECDNVKTLSNSQIDLLRCGDYLVKKDASGEHAYKVTFKSDTGMCITYHDASVIETQSYDKVDGNWVYNSEDKSELPINEEDPSFKPIYCHPIVIEFNSANAVGRLTMLIFNNSNTPYADFDTLIASIRSWGLDTARIMTSGGCYDGTNSEVVIASALDVTASTVYLFGITTTGTKSTGLNLSNETPDFFADGVNKIN